MKKLTSAGLLFTLLLLAACGGGGTGEPAAEATMAEVATPTVAVVAPSTGVTDTADVTDSGDMTETEDVTDMTGMTATETLTTATPFTDSMEMTDTGDVSGASAVTATTGMNNTDEMTETAGIEEAPSQLMRASDLQGYNVQNPAGERLGSVQDLVFNLDTGEIVLVTVEYGGFLDIGDKVFPIPLSAFRFEELTDEIPAVAPGAGITDTTTMTDPLMTGTESIVYDTLLVLDIPEETFENAPGFADDFPILTDAANVGEIETFYRDLGEDVIGRPIAETDLDALAGRAVKLSDLDGGNVQNPAGEGLGEIQDLLIDLRAGRVEHLILTFGGFLGLGANEYAIPVDAFEVIPSSADVEAGAPELVLDTTEEQLTEAPVFDEVDLDGPDWDLETRNFWLPDGE